MRISRSLVVLTGALSIIASSLAQADDAEVELRRNPFDRPVLESLDLSAAAATVAVNPNDEPGLRAVLVAGSKSAVNFGGVIIQIGETANGYKLLSVK